jgi:DUF2934 family protein
MKNGTQKKTAAASGPSKSPDLRIEIEKRAYEIWLNEGGGHGGDVDHWLQAERELATLSSGKRRETSA